MLNNIEKNGLTGIREILHRGREVVLVGFHYITELYGRCKELGGRYSRTHRGWWWPVSERTVEEVRKNFHCTPNQKHRSLLMLIYSCVLRIGETLVNKPAGMQSGEGFIYMRGGRGNGNFNSSFIANCMALLGVMGVLWVYKDVLPVSKKMKAEWK